LSLVGSLKDLPFSDILQILCLSRRSGTLYLKNGDPLVILRFQNGLLSGLDLPGEESPLIRGIRREKLVPPEVLEQSIKECRRATDSLLQNLAAKTYLDPEIVVRMVVAEVRQVLRRLLGWTDGEFRFEIGDVADREEKERLGTGDRRDGPPSNEGTLLRIPEGLDPREILLEEMQAMGAESVHHFFLPTLPGPPRPGEVRPSRATDGDRLAETGDGSLCVVLVDERSVYRDLLAGFWRKEGFRVDSFTSPEAGYQRFALLAESGAPISLVTDLVVPETGGSGYAGGLELLIRARQEFPGAKVLLMSEGVDPTVEEAARSLGARAILQKPMTLPADSEGLQEAVEALARQGSRLLRDEGAELASDLPEDDHTETIRVVDQLSLLGALLGELRRPGSDLEIPLLVLRLASEYFERGVLLAVDHQEARGLGGFAGNGDAGFMGRKCRELSLPIAPGGRLGQVLSDKTSVRGPLQHPDEQRLLEQLGGGPTSDAVLLPLLSNDQVVAILYGDNGKSASPVGDTRGLEIFLGEVGIALEKSLHHPPVESSPAEKAT
jgi:CheY-like chemotaxis protein